MSSPIADGLFEALANGLWRGGLLVIAVALFLRFIKRTSAAERYAVWLAMLTVIALAPAVEVAVRSMEPSDAAAPLAVMERGLSADWAPGAGERALTHAQLRRVHRQGCETGSPQPVARSGQSAD